jgi:hypothetical protein
VRSWRTISYVSGSGFASWLLIKSGMVSDL